MARSLPAAPGLLAVALLAAVGRGQEAVPPRAVTVLPVFFVPKGQAAPTAAESDLLVKHLDQARGRYKELLRGETFGVAAGRPRVVRSAHPLDHFRRQPEGGGPAVAGELLTHLKFTRFNCPHVLLAVVMNPADEFPAGGGRPLNGGFNTGGGFVQVSTFALGRLPNFQSTLQHELGHAFGLPHVDVYGYDMTTSESVMSYNPRHHTRGLTPSRTPGVLLPEDIRGLALNRRAFPALRFDPTADVPAGSALAKRVIPLGPMTLPGHPNGPALTTTAGEEFGTKVTNLTAGPLAANEKGRSAFDAATMWQSAKAPGGWAAVEVAFPYPVELTAVGVHSQHSGEYNAARGVRVSVAAGRGQFRQLVEAALPSADGTVAVPKVKAKEWRFEFRAGESQAVTLRGLRFYAGEDELFPPLVPAGP